MGEEINKILLHNKEIIGILASIISIFLFIWGLIYWIFKFLTNETIKIKTFGLKLEGGHNYQPFYLKGNKMALKEEILKENFFLFSGIYAFKFPELEFLFQNNSNNSYILENLKIKVNNIYNSSTPLIGITFSGKKIWFDEKKISGNYNNLYFDFKNLGFGDLNNLEVTDIIFFDKNKKIIQNKIQNKNIKINLNSGKIEKFEFDFMNKESNYTFSKLIFNLKFILDGKKINHKLTYTLGEGDIFFYNKKYGFYMIEAEIGGGGFDSEDIGKYLIPTSLGFEKLKGKEISYPLKRLIETKNIDNFSFYLGVDHPCELDINLIFDFGNKKIVKNFIIDYSFPISFDLEEYKKNSKVLLLK